MSRSSRNTAAPQTPSPQNEFFYSGNNLRSQRVYDPNRGGYVSTTFSTPQEQAIENQATGFISDLITRMPQDFNMSPERIDRYREDFAAPQRRALTDAYNDALGQANTTATSRGMRNSVGFNDYLASSLEKNRAQGLADIEANARLMEYELPRRALAPYADAFNLVNAALSGEQGRQFQSMEPAFQGSQAANNFMLSNYQNQMSRWQTQNQGKKKGNFFGWLIGKDSLY